MVTDKKMEHMLRSCIEIVEESLGVKFSTDEVFDAISSTLAKIQLNGKEQDYFWVLFPNELEDLKMRKVVSTAF